MLQREAKHNCHSNIHKFVSHCFRIVSLCYHPSQICQSLIQNCFMCTLQHKHQVWGGALHRWVRAMPWSFSDDEGCATNCVAEKPIGILAPAQQHAKQTPSRSDFPRSQQQAKPQMPPGTELWAQPLLKILGAIRNKRGNQLFPVDFETSCSGTIGEIPICQAWTNSVNRE